MIRLVREAIDVASLRAALLRPEDGALVVFEGTARNRARGRRVCALEYQAYEPMALKKLEEICDQARRAFDIRTIAIVHRLGRLLPGQCGVAIIVCAAHRAPAFEACRFAIDRLKKTVPIWKKEYYDDGACWVEAGD